MKKRILILFAHPALEKSRVNIRLMERVSAMEMVTFRDMYQLYPDFDFDLDMEKKLVAEHDILIYHHPFFWYSAPSILKDWQDLVFEHGWAYGHNGHVLEGKGFMSIISTGGPEKAYKKEPVNNFTMRELLAPFERAANVCKMQYIPPFVVHGALGIKADEIERHANELVELLFALSESKIDLEKTRHLARINEDISAIINTSK